MPRIVNLIPMAGAGQRFIDAGYHTPKPLIKIQGLPMVVHAARSLPPADLWLFVCRQEHIADARIDEELKRYFSPCRVISVDHLTEGQASTCLLAREELRSDDLLTIGACDNSMIWHRPEDTRQFLEDGIDFAVWTFRRNPAVLQNPRSYGWVRTLANGKISGVSVKVPISSNPIEDHAVVGSFSFRRAGFFLDACDDMIRADSRINNEFYVDNAINFALKRGLVGQPLEVERYVCWGTPNDLEIYEYWRTCFCISKGVNE